MLPDYQASVERRYPPVCAACLPAVEEEIGKRNHMARTNALGRWLKQSKGKQKQTAATVEDLVHFDRDLKMWKLRGCLWLLTLVGFIAGNTAGRCELFNMHYPELNPFCSGLITVSAIVKFNAFYPHLACFRGVSFPFGLFVESYIRADQEGSTPRP